MSFRDPIVSGLTPYRRASGYVFNVVLPAAATIILLAPLVITYRFMNASDCQCGYVYDALKGCVKIQGPPPGCDNAGSGNQVGTGQGGQNRGGNYKAPVDVGNNPVGNNPKDPGCTFR